MYGGCPVSLLTGAGAQGHRDNMPLPKGTAQQQMLSQQKGALPQDQANMVKLL